MRYGRVQSRVAGYGCVCAISASATVPCVCVYASVSRYLCMYLYLCMYTYKCVNCVHYVNCERKLCTHVSTGTAHAHVNAREHVHTNVFANVIAPWTCAHGNARTFGQRMHKSMFMVSHTHMDKHKSKYVYVRASTSIVSHVV